MEKYFKKLSSVKFKTKKLLNPNQSGFRPSDTCINQLFAITHEIFEAFDCNPSLQVRSVFLDMSKAFDKVWHNKFKSTGISGKLYNPLENYLSGRLQRVILNGQTSSWRPDLTVVSKRLILGPILFLVYINNLHGELTPNVNQNYLPMTRLSSLQLRIKRNV